MLIKITESCSMGCPHCLNDSKPNGRDMSMDTARLVMRFIKKYLNDSRSSTYLISGGEPTEHHDFMKICEYFLDEIEKLRGIKYVVITTNGFWILSHKDEARKLVSRARQGMEVFFQVSADKRYYPKRLDVSDPIWKEKGFMLVDNCVGWVYPLGRARGGGYPINHKATACANIRLIAAQMGSENKLSRILDVLKASGKVCTPSIKVDGGIGLGESDLCPSVGSVFMSDEDILKAIRSFRCNKCYPLNRNLAKPIREMLGE